MALLDEEEYSGLVDNANRLAQPMYSNLSFALEEGSQVMVYSNLEQIILQLRRETPTETDVLQPSFKVAVMLTPSEALGLASELLQGPSSQLEKKNI